METYGTLRIVLLSLSAVLLTACAAADLTVRELSLSPSSPTTETEITFNAVVENEGSRSSNLSMLAFKVGGETIPKFYKIPALDPGETYAVERKLVLGVAQNYQNTVTVDVNNDVTELREDNNQAIQFYTVAPAFSIGDTGPAGGIVFYVTDGGLHGLEAAPEDQSTGAEWGCYGTFINGADGVAVGTGLQNTADILAGCSTAGIAARVADAYTLNGHDDWFLPSKDELNLMYLSIGAGSITIGNVGGFANGYYWSSSEGNSSNAWLQGFGSGDLLTSIKNDTLVVRAVRAF